MSEPVDNLIRGFTEGIRGHPDHVLALVDPSAAFEQGRQAARTLMTAIVWAKSIGETIDTAQATATLGVSRQALAKRLAAGSIIGLPSKRTTIYPSWQFDLHQKIVRPEVAAIVQAFEAELGYVDMQAVSRWAVNPQSEDLDGISPAEWVQQGKDPVRVIEAARRTARRLAA